jgi:hypothetical protein
MLPGWLIVTCAKHKILRAIDMNVILSWLTEDDHCKTTEFMQPQHQLLDKYKDYHRL